MRVAQELLGAPTIGGGSVRPGGGGGGSQRSQTSLLSCRVCAKTAPKQQFPSLIDLLTKTPFFFLKVLNKIYFHDDFEEYINFKIFCFLWHCGVIPVQSFRSHIRPQPPGLGLNVFIENFVSGGSLFCHRIYCTSWRSKGKRWDSYLTVAGDGSSDPLFRRARDWKAQ